MSGNRLRIMQRRFPLLVVAKQAGLAAKVSKARKLVTVDNRSMFATSIPEFMNPTMRRLLGVHQSVPQGMPWADLSNRQRWFLSHFIKGWDFHARTPVMAVAWIIVTQIRAQWPNLVSAGNSRGATFLGRIVDAMDMANPAEAALAAALRAQLPLGDPAA